jgi:CHAD domain-containing protein
VLAERGEVMAAERAAIRRGLAIGRAAHRPPASRRKARGHAPIVTPLGTVLLMVGVGVALLAKSQRGRRVAVPDRVPPDRRPALLAGEPYAEGLRRVVLGQLDLAIELLEDFDEAQTNGAYAVHEIRKALKRLRALLRLLHRELGAKRYARESVALRDCARRLAGARDAEVMLATLDGLVQRDPHSLASSAAVQALLAQLLAERDAAAALVIGDRRVRGEVLGELRSARSRAERWELRERGFKLLEPGLEGVYRRGRRELRTARRRRSVEALHVWRKRVKELRYAAETLDRGGASYKRARGVARRADRLGEALGEEHDLALLATRVRERPRQFAGERKTRKRLLKSIARRRKALRKDALQEGERLYRRPPRRFVRHLARAR